MMDSWLTIMMGEHPLRSILSRIIRGTGKAEEVELSYLHRGAPEDQVMIRVSSISKLGKGWFLLSDGETQIPYHRILRIVDLGSGKVLWEKRRTTTSTQHQ